MPLRAIGQSALPERPKIPNPGEKCGLAWDASPAGPWWWQQPPFPEPAGLCGVRIGMPKATDVDEPLRVLCLKPVV